MSVTGRESVGNRTTSKDILDEYLQLADAATDNLQFGWRLICSPPTSVQFCLHSSSSQEFPRAVAMEIKCTQQTLNTLTMRPASLRQPRTKYKLPRYTQRQRNSIQTHTLKHQTAAPADGSSDAAAIVSHALANTYKTFAQLVASKSAFCCL